MKKILLLAFCLFYGFTVLAEDEKKEIEIKTEKEKTERPYSLKKEISAYQNDAIIFIQIPDASSCVSVTVVNTETGEQVHSMVYSGSNEIVINLSDKEEGFYTLYIEVDGTEYSGTFIL